MVSSQDKRKYSDLLYEEQILIHKRSQIIQADQPKVEDNRSLSNEENSIESMSFVQR